MMSTSLLRRILRGGNGSGRFDDDGRRGGWHAFDFRSFRLGQDDSAPALRRRRPRRWSSVTQSAASLTSCAACPIATPTPASRIISMSFSASPTAMTFSESTFMSLSNCLSADAFRRAGRQDFDHPGHARLHQCAPAPPTCIFNCQRSALMARGSPMAISLLIGDFARACFAAGRRFPARFRDNC